MRIDQTAQALVIQGEEGATLRVYSNNRGEPYRDGIEISLELDDTCGSNRVFLDPREAIQLRDKLNELLPPDIPLGPLSPDDRFFHAADKTWWKAGPIAGLTRAGPGPAMDDIIDAEITIGNCPTPEPSIRKLVTDFYTKHNMPSIADSVIGYGRNRSG